MAKSSKNKIADKMKELGYGPIDKKKMDILYKLISIRLCSTKRECAATGLNSNCRVYEYN